MFNTRQVSNALVSVVGFILFSLSVTLLLYI